MYFSPGAARNERHLVFIENLVENGYSVVVE